MKHRPPNHVPFDPNDLKQNDMPELAISEWQYWGDPDGRQSTAHERAMEEDSRRAQEWEMANPVRFTFVNGQYEPFSDAVRCAPNPAWVNAEPPSP